MSEKVGEETTANAENQPPHEHGVVFQLEYLFNLSHRKQIGEFLFRYEEQINNFKQSGGIDDEEGNEPELILALCGMPEREPFPDERPEQENNEPRRIKERQIKRLLTHHCSAPEIIVIHHAFSIALCMHALERDVDRKFFYPHRRLYHCIYFRCKYEIIFRETADRVCRKLNADLAP